MRTSSATDRGREAGFTLAELLVAIAIMALATTVVVLTMSPGGHPARDAAVMLAGKTAGLRDEAILRNRPLALWVEPTSYGFERWDGEGWQPFDEPPFAAAETFEDGVRAELGGRSRIRFDAVGMPDAPATLRLVDEKDGRATLTVSAHGEVGAL
ncbi:GspH/FimT family pseudopilin [Sphingomicrobium nitratireducens]|uniref:GspH/FimT family pseudopilin n=1 Tax=Sphingomicrobium nitratireducens TaxID=2964666 RepID=UPI00223F306E|nr:GspH/FimT family pseudopilin [Sphingomicrobium nitratireducens]